MIDIFSQSSIPVVSQSIFFAQARHNVLAGNLANMDTPGYRIRDLNVDEFQDRLKEAIEVRDRKPESVSENSPGKQTTDNAMQKVKDATRDILYHDKSDLSLEKQVLEISKNRGYHNTAIAILTSQYRLLNIAISERV